MLYPSSVPELWWVASALQRNAYPGELIATSLVLHALSLSLINCPRCALGLTDATRVLVYHPNLFRGDRSKLTWLRSVFGEIPFGCIRRLAPAFPATLLACQVKLRLKHHTIDIYDDTRPSPTLAISEVAWML